MFGPKEQPKSAIVKLLGSVLQRLVTIRPRFLLGIRANSDPRTTLPLALACGDKHPPFVVHASSPRSAWREGVCWK